MKNVSSKKSSLNKYQKIAIACLIAIPLVFLSQIVFALFPMYGLVGTNNMSPEDKITAEAKFDSLHQLFSGLNIVMIILGLMFVVLMGYGWYVSTKPRRHESVQKKS